MPGLAVVLVGDNAASKTYVAQQIARGGRSRHAAVRSSSRRRRPSEAELLALVQALNADPAVHGILVQLPLPPQIDAARVIDSIDPDKDVDGFHPLNAGRLVTGCRRLVPCTPIACIKLDQDRAPFARRHRRAGGRPLATSSAIRSRSFCSMRTRPSPSRIRTPAICRTLPPRRRSCCVAIGRAEFIRGDWIKPGATVIDVGINRVPDAAANRGSSATSNFAEAIEVAGAITPVPGGVGPMTIVCLLVNTLRAACAQAGLPPPASVIRFSYSSRTRPCRARGCRISPTARHRLAAERAVEFDRVLVFRQRPHDQRFQRALRQIAPRGGEQPAAEAEPLEFRPQIKLVDLAVIVEAARAVAAVIGVAGDLVAELQERDAAAFADGRFPPRRTAAIDQLFEFGARDDALIGRPPRLVVGIGDRAGIAGSGAADFDEDRCS